MSDLSYRHFQHILGPIAVREQTEDRPGGLRILSFVSRHQVDCVTVGLDQMSIDALHPAELLCTVLPGQEEAATYLLDMTIGAAVNGGFPLILGSVLQNETPLLAGTDIYGALLTTCLWTPELDILRDSDGAIALHVIGVLPLTGEEIDWIEANGSDAFDEVIESTAVDLMDVTRPSTR